MTREYGYSLPSWKKIISGVFVVETGGHNVELVVGKKTSSFSAVIMFYYCYYQSTFVRMKSTNDSSPQ